VLELVELSNETDLLIRHQERLEHPRTCVRPESQDRV
jgi:hypothetical protein